jgi:hypothetical protein
MLPSTYHQGYQAFQQAVQQIADSLTALQGSDGNGEIAPTLLVQIADLQQTFQTQIVNLPIEELDSGMSSQIQSYQTEMHKQLRLLMMDVNFLKAARQPATVEQRLQQMGDRLQLLMRYCSALLER